MESMAQSYLAHKLISFITKQWRAQW